MTIETSKGKTYAVKWIFALSHNANQILIEYADDRPLAEIAAEFDGLETITKTDTSRPGVKEVYEGFTQLAGVQRMAAGSVRVTLEKGDAA